MKMQEVLQQEPPRPEHPNPQFQRGNWLSLNGWWDFEFDFNQSGMDQKFYEHAEFGKKILVPFCVESELSGIGYKDFVPCCWYRRFFELTQDQLSGNVFLHFDAVDYESHVWINGHKAGDHKGGYASFQLDITDMVTGGQNEVVLCVYDDVRSGKQPRGKQSDKYESYRCLYTRTTGIWQSVWLEFTPKEYIKSFRFYPNVAESYVTIQAEVSGRGVLQADIFWNGRLCGSKTAGCGHGTVSLEAELAETHLWKPGEGNLYDVRLKFREDVVESYFGLREVTLDGYRFLINGTSVFQRLVLDQGFYPDGICTAPSCDALERDILLAMELGFNGARLHQKVFEPRFLYYCDKHGYMVWGEMGSWGLDITDYEAYENFVPEWMEILERDFNHPSIIGWCPFNETWDVKGRRQINSLIEHVYKLTKWYDRTRPCIDTSGNYHVITDIFDLHDYTQDLDEFHTHYDGFGLGTEPFYDRVSKSGRQVYQEGLPVMVSEFGGIKWVSKHVKDAWGYGNGPATEEEFIDRYKGMVQTLLDNPKIMGFCYTQLIDVEQECNGLYYYNRTPKFDSRVFYEINTRKAVIET